MAVVVITSVSRVGDTLTINGAVDGVPVSATGWVSAVGAMTKAQKITYAQGLLAAVVPPAPVDLTTQFQ